MTWNFKKKKRKYEKHIQNLIKKNSNKKGAY